MKNQMSVRPVVKKKHKSVPIHSQPTRMMPPQTAQQQGPMNQMQPQQPPMKKGGKVKAKMSKKKC